MNLFRRPEKSTELPINLQFPEFSQLRDNRYYFDLILDGKASEQDVIGTFEAAKNELISTSLKPLLDLVRKSHDFFDAYIELAIDRNWALSPESFHFERVGTGKFDSNSSDESIRAIGMGAENVTNQIKQFIKRSGLDIRELPYNDQTKNIYRDSANYATIAIEKGKPILFIQPNQSMQILEYVHEILAWYLISEGFKKIPRTHQALVQKKNELDGTKLFSLQYLILNNTKVEELKPLAA